MIKEIPYDLTAEERVEHETRFGRFNDPPPGWRQINDRELYELDPDGSSIVKVEYRQIFQPGRGIFVHLFYLADNTGYAFETRRDGPPIFYRFGCDHEFADPKEECRRRGIHLFSMQHAQWCPKCGYFATFDSSD